VKIVQSFKLLEVEKEDIPTGPTYRWRAAAGSGPRRHP
jgi:hypothetical protein